MGSKVADAFNVIVAALEKGQEKGIYNLDDAGQIYNALGIMQPLVQKLHNSETQPQSQRIEKENKKPQITTEGKKMETINFVKPIIKNI